MLTEHSITHNNNNNNNCIVAIKGPRRGGEFHIKQVLIQCTYNNTTFLPDRIRDKVIRTQIQ
jgi:hypothetical protein